MTDWNHTTPLVDPADLGKAMVLLRVEGDNPSGPSQDSAHQMSAADLINRSRVDLAASAGATLVGADDGASGTQFTTVQGFITKLMSSAGSSIVGFIQTGTGAVFRWVQDKLRDTVSVKDFGAKGDGATDDSAAVSNAIASGREVYFPAGNYKIAPRTFTNMLSSKIRGAGRDVTKITLASTGTGLTFSNCQWLQISDMSIQATGTAQTLANAIGVQFDTGSSNCVVERVNFYGFSLDGLRMVGTALSPLSGNTVRDCYFLGCGRYQVYEYYNNDATWDNIQIGKLAGITHATFGWYRENCGETGISSIKVWENFRGYKALNCTGTRHAACRIELSDYENVWIEGGYDNIINGCRFYSASQNGNGLYDNVYFKDTLRPTLTNSSIVTWDATYSKWGVNFDGTCDDMTVSGNTINGFYTANFGPIRFGGNVTRVTGDLIVWFTGTAVASGSTSYPSNGSSTAEAAAYRSMNRQYAVVKLYTATDAAPGAAQTYTYTLRKNGGDTAMTCQSAGASSFSAITTSPSPQITYDEGDFLAVKLVTSGTAAVANHRGHIILVAY